MSGKKSKVVVICGPTGVGKTAVSLEIADRFCGEIIGADSMQVYRHMDIGTAKPTRYECARIPHHMIDLINPDESMDVARYADLAHREVNRLFEKGVAPIVVGGTGLYIKGLIDGIFRAKFENRSVRSHLEKAAALFGVGGLYQQLKARDPGAAGKIHPNDRYRIIRALEVFETTGKTITEHHREHRFSGRRFKVLKIALRMDRDVLYHRINDRCDAMITEGLVDETKRLLQMGYHKDLKSMHAIGYRHMIDFLSGRMPWNEAVRTFKRDTRRYAKRQLTWFKSDAETVWVDPGRIGHIRVLVERFLQT
ncbi:MAG: tRNA (adenosine(37)-N6)-dimethylallyltransferase MiaA [Desulfobacterales bacterium]